MCRLFVRIGRYKVLIVIGVNKNRRGDIKKIIAESFIDYDYLERVQGVRGPW